MTNKISINRSDRAATKAPQQVGWRWLSTILLLIALIFMIAACDAPSESGAGGSGNSDDTTSEGEAPSDETGTSEIISSRGAGWQLYFTDPDSSAGENPNPASGLSAVLIEQINKAQDTIDVALFELKLPPVAEALTSAHERGVLVRVMTDNEGGIEADGEAGGGQFAMLKEAGIELKDDARSTQMHNTFWVFDGQSVWAGSTTHTREGHFSDNNDSLVLESPEVAAIYEREFEEMWGGEFGITSPSSIGEQEATVDGAPIKVLFGAEDELIVSLMSLIEGAEHNIRFMSSSFTLEELQIALSEQAAAGVEVKGIFEARGSTGRYSQMGALSCAGVEVRLDGNSGTMNHNLLLIDDELVATGSLRFTASSADNNDENVLIISNPELADAYLAEFERLWATGSEPSATGCQGKEESSSETTAGGSGGDWWQVYFTDPTTINNPDDLTGSIPEKLTSLINNAEYSIHIASFEFNLTPVAEALIEARNRGVDVRWVTDDEHGIEADEEEDHGQFHMMEQDGIEIRDDARSGLMHNKFWIFDEQTVWTGSTNITQNDNFRNNNNVIVIESPALATIYEREFEEMWNGEFGTSSPSTVDQQSLTIEATPIQVLFASEDDVASKLIPLIESAQKSIRFMAFSFTHDEMGAAVLARADAGVDVMGIFETRASETQYSEMPPLYCAGIPVRQDGNPGTFHHKVFIIDEQLVITGSFNFSENANKSNDENTFIVTNADIATLYLQEFERRWAEGKDPDAADMKCK